MDNNLDKKNALPDFNSGNASQFLGHFGSNTCQSGAPNGTTLEPLFKRGTFR